MSWAGVGTNDCKNKKNAANASDFDWIMLCSVLKHMKSEKIQYIKIFFLTHHSPFYKSSIVIRGKMGHGGKMEHRVFGIKCAMCGSIVISMWFPPLASVAWHNKVKLIDDHILNTTKNAISPYSIILMYKFAHVPESTLHVILKRFTGG